MFSGIIEEFATVTAIRKDRENIDFTLTCSFVDQLKIDQSVAHNGVCLTVVSIDLPTDPSGMPTYTVTAMKETLDRTNLGLLKVGDKVNVERSMLMNGRLDGLSHRQRRLTNRLQPHVEYLPGSHHPLHLRAHQFLRHTCRKCRKHRV